jgi:hypothetical protein
MRGLERFRAHFAGYENNYVLIGGAACDVLMDEVGLATFDQRHQMTGSSCAAGAVMANS